GTAVTWDAAAAGPKFAFSVAGAPQDRVLVLFRRLAQESRERIGVYSATAVAATAAAARTAESAAAAAAEARTAIPGVPVYLRAEENDAEDGGGGKSSGNGDNAGGNSIGGSSSGRTPQIEREHVRAVYDVIAAHWDRTRYKPWPRVATFLAGLPPGSLVADIGCGNGKYLRCGTGGG
ncbi:unnamed protein product, partial [Phaeothamnion confervicola]